MSKVIDILEMELDEELPHWLSTEAKNAGRLDEIRARKRAEAQNQYANRTKTKAALRRANKLLQRYSDDEPRDEQGRWTDAGGGDGGSDEGSGGGAAHATVSGYSPGVKVSGSDKSVRAVKQQWADASPIKTLDQLVAAAPPAQKQLGDVGRAIGEKYGVQFKDPGVKTKDAEGIARTKVKIAERGGVAARVSDVARATFIINKPEQADQIAAELGKRFEVTHENWKLTDLGYFDRTANVRMPNGTIAEVQMMDANMANAKSSKEKGGGGGHDLYVQSRDLVSSKNPADKEKYDSLVAAQQALYGSVAANYPADWKAAYMKAAADQAS
jgi:hypothetical protein